jgi:hypothetical protein
VIVCGDAISEAVSWKANSSDETRCWKEGVNSAYVARTKNKKLINRDSKLKDIRTIQMYLQTQNGEMLRLWIDGIVGQ